jgi:hypothetical protein
MTNSADTIVIRRIYEIQMSGLSKHSGNILTNSKPSDPENSPHLKATFDNKTDHHFRHRQTTEVLTAVVMKSTIFWNITPCSPVSVNHRFGGTYCHLLARWFLSELNFRP